MPENLTITDSIDSNCDVITISDDSNYGAGSLSARSSYGLTCFIFDKTVSGDTEMIVSFGDQIDDTDSKNTVSKFTVENNDGGYYEAIIFSVPDYEVGRTYGKDELAYDDSNEVFYKSLKASNIGNALTDTNWWEEIEDYDDFTPAIDIDGSLEYDIHDLFIYCNMEEKIADELLDIDCTCMCRCSMDEVIDLRRKYDKAKNYYDEGNFDEAQKLNEEVISDPETHF